MFETYEGKIAGERIKRDYTLELMQLIKDWEIKDVFSEADRTQEEIEFQKRWFPYVNKFEIAKISSAEDSKDDLRRKIVVTMESLYDMQNGVAILSKEQSDELYDEICKLISESYDLKEFKLDKIPKNKMTLFNHLGIDYHDYAEEQAIRKGEMYIIKL